MCLGFPGGGGGGGVTAARDPSVRSIRSDRSKAITASGPHSPRPRGPFDLRLIGCGSDIPTHGTELIFPPFLIHVWGKNKNKKY